MADMDRGCSPERNEGDDVQTPRMQYIENIDLRTQVVNELRKAVFKKSHTLAMLTGCEVFVKVLDEASVPQFYGTEYFIRQYYEEGIKAEEEDFAVSGVTGLPAETTEQEEALDLSCKRQDGGAKAKHLLENDASDYPNQEGYNELHRNDNDFNPIHIELDPPMTSGDHSKGKNHNYVNSTDRERQNTSNGKQRANSGPDAASVPLAYRHPKKRHHEAMSNTNREIDYMNKHSRVSHKRNFSSSSLPDQSTYNSCQNESTFVDSTSNGPVALTMEPHIHVETSNSGLSHGQSSSQDQTNQIQEIKSYLIPLANVAVSLLLQRAQSQNSRQPIDKDALIAQAQALRVAGNDPQSAQAEELAKQAFAAALDLTVKSQEQNVIPGSTLHQTHINHPSTERVSPGHKPQNCKTVGVKDLLVHEAKKQKVSHSADNLESMNISAYNNQETGQAVPPQLPPTSVHMTPQNDVISPRQQHLITRPVLLPGMPLSQYSPTRFPPPPPYTQLSPTSPQFQGFSSNQQVGPDPALLFQQQRTPLSGLPHQHHLTSNQTVRELLAQNVRRPPPLQPTAAINTNKHLPLPPPLIKKEPRDQARRGRQRSFENYTSPPENLHIPKSSDIENGIDINQQSETEEVRRDGYENTENKARENKPRENRNTNGILANIKQEPLDPEDQEMNREPEKVVQSAQNSPEREDDDDDSDSRLYIDTCENSPVENDDDDTSSRDDRDDKGSQGDGDGKDSSDGSNQGKEAGDDPKKRRFKCEICGKVYAKNESLKYHKMNHNNYRPHQCETCGRAFANPYTLDVHRRIHLNESDKPYKCKYCEKTFATSSHRNVHMTHHKEVKSFECSICRRRYLNKETLESHMQRHGERRYPCETCGMSFKAHAELTEHKTVHGLSKKSQCELCGHEFLRRNELLQHMTLEHPNAKPFECENCDKTFATLDSLRVHQRCHTGELPHKCRFCSRQFVHGKHREVHEMSHFKENNKSMNIQMLVNTGGKLFYQCEKCGQIFTELSHLQTHQKLHKLQEKEEAMATQAGMPIPNKVLPPINEMPSGATIIPVSSMPPNSLGLHDSVSMSNGPQIANVVSLHPTAGDHPGEHPGVVGMQRNVPMMPMSNALPVTTPGATANLQSPPPLEKRPPMMSPEALVPTNQHNSATPLTNVVQSDGSISSKSETPNAKMNLSDTQLTRVSPPKGRYPQSTKEQTATISRWNSEDNEKRLETSDDRSSATAHLLQLATGRGNVKN